jgi:NNP family nitrate/nitrite transporter-like MFS transporter
VGDIQKFTPFIDQKATFMLALSHTQSGAFFFFISLGYFTGLLFSGFISEKIRHKQVIAFSGLGIGLILLSIATFTSYGVIATSLVALGIVAGFYLPSGIATITHLVAPENWGRAFSIHEWAPNLAFITAPLLAELFLAWMSWQHVFFILGGSILAVSLLYLRYGRGGPYYGHAPNLGILKVLFTNRSFWIMIFLFGLGMGGSLGIYTMLPLYLVKERGFDETWVNTLIGLSRISGLFMTLVSGWLTDRIGPKRAIGIILLSTGSVTILLGMLRGDWILPMVFLQPLFATCFFPAGFAALSMIASREIQNVTVSFTIPFSFLLGGGAIPTLIGFTGDMGSFGTGISWVGVITLGSLAILRFLKFQEETAN